MMLARYKIAANNFARIAAALVWAGETDITDTRLVVLM